MPRNLRVVHDTPGADTRFPKRGPPLLAVPIVSLFALASLVGCEGQPEVTDPSRLESASPEEHGPSSPGFRWSEVAIATGGPDGAECATQEFPSPECCQAFPGLPGCSWGACGDERDDIIREYVFYSVSLSPSCSDFASSGGSTHFSWTELNGGFSNGNPHSPFGMVKAALLDGLESTRTNYNGGGITLTSGYRCPHGNFGVGGVAQSFHMHGRAGDMYSASHSWTEQEFNLLKAAADSTSPPPIESFFWHTYTDRHYHAAW